MAIVEDDAHSVVAYRLQRGDFHQALAAYRLLLAAAWPCTSALGDSTRRYSAASTKRAPDSKATVKLALSGTAAFRSARAFQRPSRCGFGQFARLGGQHDRHAVADRIGEPRELADQLLLLAIIDAAPSW